jgi:hypothetical protein
MDVCIRNVDFIAAIRWLCALAGEPIPERLVGKRRTVTQLAPKAVHRAG